MQEGCFKGDLAVTDLIQAQLLDPFRIGLVIALVVTMFRTRGATGTLLPLALGVVFVAVILPTTNPPAGVTLTDAVLAGLASNLIILAIVLALALAWRRLRG
jgi:hypothetical protein